MAAYIQLLLLFMQTSSFIIFSFDPHDMQVFSFCCICHFMVSVRKCLSYCQAADDVFKTFQTVFFCSKLDNEKVLS
jgi:hypothetical protein